MSTVLKLKLDERAPFLDEFNTLLNGDLELFRYEIDELTHLYGSAYTADATFILSKLEEFAAARSHTLKQVLRIYQEFAEQILEDNKAFIKSGRYQYRSEEEIRSIVDDPAFQLHYLYILTLSTPLNRSRYEVFVNFRDVVGRHISRDSVCLEIGGGNCIDSLFLSDYGSVDVYERNETSLEWRDLLGAQDRIDLRIEYYAFGDRDRYDFVAMIELLEHVSAPADYLRGAYDVLKTDGCAYLTFAIRMPQVDHIYQFDSIEECQRMLHEAGFSISEEFCTINTHQPFPEEERWNMAADRRFAVTYCVLARKQAGSEVPSMIDEFNDAM